MDPKDRRPSAPKQTDETKPDDATKDTIPASDSAAFTEPPERRSNDTPLDEEREQDR